MKNGMEQLKKIWVYAVLIWKRMWKTPGYLLVFLLVPIILLSVSQISKGETEVKVAVCIEGLSENGSTEEADYFNIELKERLEAREGTIVFSFYESEEEVKREVAVAQAECGFVVPEGVFEELQEKHFKNSISCFVSPQTSTQTICKEAFFAELFSLYEEYTFPEQASEMIVVELGESEEAKKEDIANRAEELLEQYRFNGSTFQFEYEDYKSESAQREELSTEAVSEESESVFPVRGICALLVFICALCGAMDALEDENAKRICRLNQKNCFSALTVLMPAFVMSVISICCYAITGVSDGLWKEIGAMLIYLLLSAIVCMILKRLCRREENLASVMSILILLTAVVCPVFVDLSQFVPVLKIFGKMFPTYYYLAMF